MSLSLGQLIKQHSMKSVQSLKLMELMEAEVVSEPPELKIKLKGSDKLIIPKELIVVAEHLCEVKRKVNLVNKAKIVDGKKTKGQTTIGEQEFSLSFSKEKHPVYPYPIHTHTGKVKVALTDREFTMEQGELHYINDDEEDDLLKKGDKVMVISFEGGQRFFIADRIFQYE
ncbi:DUF2577 family protein [Paenibacillus sp. NEAU-GSW1]|uniref:DUF2577 family protein n=1 Tax=Paenibacillus sp. NEAU-GSW1 TaxID=2682486 RepID=UPI0015676C6F|nr:DUF2577 family protein [Paenibacillus sp. NEAU-GSW1]